MDAGHPTAHPVDGRTALVTGAGRGLGPVLARALVGRGARAVLVGRDEAALTRTGRAIDPTGQRWRAETCDVSHPGSVAALAEAVADEEISILVNNAGIGGPVRSLPDIEPEAWDEVFAVNVRGPYLLCRAFVPAMVRRGGGDIVNLASVTGKRPLAGRTPYAASKMAVLGLTRTLAAELGPHGVRVNALSPGPVESDRMDHNFRMEAERTGTSPDVARAELAARAALGRLVRPEEVADGLLAILSVGGLTGADLDLSAGTIAP